MTRADEIKALQSLKGDTYFAHLFSDAQIDAMCENIKNDFPIEMGIALFDASDVAKENGRLKFRLEQATTVAVEAAGKLLSKGDDALDDIAESLVGTKNCLRLKLHNAYRLTESDREELLRIIDQNA
jgi:hypothetical protein